MAKTKEYQQRKHQQQVRNLAEKMAEDAQKKQENVAATPVEAEEVQNLQEQQIHQDDINTFIDNFDTHNPSDADIEKLKSLDLSHVSAERIFHIEQIMKDLETYRSEEQNVNFEDLAKNVEDRKENFNEQEKGEYDESKDMDRISEKYGISDNCDQVLANYEALKACEEKLTKDGEIDFKQLVSEDQLKELDSFNFTKDAKSEELLSQEEREKEIELLLKQIYNQSVLRTSNSTLPIDNESFKDTFQKTLAQELKLLKEVGKTQEDGKIVISQQHMAAWQAGQQADLEKGYDLQTRKAHFVQPEKIADLETREKYTKQLKIRESFREKAKSLDTRMTERYGTSYTIAKNIAKSAAWGAAYTAGTALGVSWLVAGASFGNQLYGIAKDYAKAKEQNTAAIKQGQPVKPLTITQYLKDNKLRVAGAATSALSFAGLPGGYKRAVGASLALAGAFKQATQAYKAAPEGQKNKAAWKAIGVAVVAYVGSWVVSSSMAHGANSHTTEAETPTVETPTVEAPQVETSVPETPTPIEPSAEVSQESSPWQDTNTWAQERMAEWNDTVPSTHTDVQTPLDPDAAPVNDSESGQGVGDQGGEATAPIDWEHLTSEQQHDLRMLALRDPAEANEILGNTGDKWMSSSEIQKGFEDGTFTDEQKRALLEFADKRFDARGNFQDVEGRPSAAQMESDAAKWTAAHQAHTATVDQTASDTPSHTESEAPKVEANEGRRTLSELASHGQENRHFHMKKDENGKVHLVADGAKEQTSTGASQDQASTYQVLNGENIQSVNIRNGQADISYQYQYKTDDVVHTGVVHTSVTEDGKYLSVEYPNHTYTQEELNNMNNDPKAVAMGKSIYNDAKTYVSAQTANTQTNILAQTIAQNGGR